MCKKTKSEPCCKKLSSCFSEEMKGSQMFRQVVELRNDIATNGCIAGGIECCDLTAHTVQRRPQTTGQLFLEKLYFVKHVDNNSLADSPREREILAEYRNLLYSIILNGLRQWSKSGVLAQITNGEQFEHALKLLEGKEGIPTVADEERKRKFLDDSKCSLVNALDELFNLPTNNPLGEGQDNAKKFEQVAVNKLSAFYKTFDNDRYWSQALLHDRFSKSAQDICMENSATHRNRACGVELSSTDVLKHCVNGSKSHPLLEIEWTCVGPHMEHQLFLEKLYFVKHVNSLADSPREREILAEYRNLLYSIILNGLRQWSKSGVLAQITNGNSSNTR